MHIHQSVFYRAQHVTGPAAVLVSIQFGVTPAAGPRLIRLLTDGIREARPRFDYLNHVAEIVAGVAQANLDLGGNLAVAAIELVPDDYPQAGQARKVAYDIASALIRGEI